MYKIYKTLLCLAMVWGSVGWAWAQQTITGTVTDERTGEPMIGASILIKGSTTGTITDLDGNFTLTVSSTDGLSLMISSIGYLTQEIQIGSSISNLNIQLKQDATNLEEVVVTGLATSVKRSNLANAVTSVSSKDLMGTTTVQTTDGALYGKVPGATIRSNGGAPGGGISIQLRGISTLVGASQPLIIVDGIYVSNATQRTGRGSVTGAGATTQDDGSNRLADINPADIESIEVLKGPSAAAIYGTRANAGVIIITTKKGKEGRTTVSLSQDVGFANPLRLLGVDDWSEDKINFFFPENRRPVELVRYNVARSSGNFFDYEDYFYNNKATLLNTRVSVSGGNEKTKFYVSGGITDEEGTIKNTGFKRYSIRANVDQKITNSIRLGVTSNFIRSDTDRGFTGNQNNSGASIGYALAYVPNYFDLRRNEDGTYPVNPYFSENPVAVTENGINNSMVNRFLQAFTLDIDLLKTSNSFLKAQISGGLDYMQNSTLIYLPEFLQYQSAQANPGDILKGRQESFNTNFQAALVYNWNLGTVNMNSSGGMVRLDFENSALFNRGRGLVPGQTNLQQAAIQSIDQDYSSKVSDAGVFLQQEMNWEDKIIGTVGIRWDKSTLNGDPNKMYAFPRASIAFNVANFGFWNPGVISQLKPRIAYGETAGPVQFGHTFTPLTGTNIGGLLGSVVSPQIGNSMILPETAQEIEFGVDMGFFNNRLSLEATYYIKNTQNNIQNLNLSPSTGVNTTPSNEAEMQNKGIELSISGSPIESGNFRWFSRLMFWKNDLMMTKLGIPTYTSGAFGSALGTFLYAEGYSPTTIVGSPAAADNPGGFTFWGDAQPDFNVSFFNSISLLKGLELSFLIDWKKGGDNVNLTSYLNDGGGTTKGWFDDDNGDGIPNGRQRPPEPYNSAGRWVQDASFVKVREIGLYYTLPQSTISEWFGNSIQSIKLGSSVNNAFLFTDYEGYDPETSTFGAQAVANNVDVAPYPTQKRVFFHITVDF